MSKQPLVSTTRSPRAFASATSATSSASCTTPSPPLPKPCSARCSSERVTVATPILPTTMPAPRFASAAASPSSRPAATPAASSAITVSPAPVTSNTSRARVGSVSGSASRRNSVMPCSPRVTSSASKIELGAQRRPLAKQIRLVGARADDGLELAAVRRQRERAAVALEVRALRVDERRHAGRAARRDELRRAAQRALRVVGEHDGVDAAHELRERPAELLGARRERLLRVDADELLAARDHAQLVDRRHGRGAHELAAHAALLDAAP